MRDEMDSGAGASLGGADLRRHPRAPFRAWVELEVGGGVLRAAGRDLSAGGLGVELPDPCPAPTGPVRGEFALPGIRLPLAVEAEVVWTDTRRARAGLRFCDLDPAVAELLESFVSGRLA